MKLLNATTLDREAVMQRVAACVDRAGADALLHELVEESMPQTGFSPEMQRSLLVSHIVYWTAFLEDEQEAVRQCVLFSSAWRG